MSDIKNLTINGVNYVVDDHFQAVKDTRPVSTAETVLTDGDEVFSILSMDDPSTSTSIKYPVVLNGPQMGVLTGNITLTLDPSTDPEQVEKKTRELGYRSIGGRGRALLLQSTGDDILQVIPDARDMTKIDGVQRASPQVLFHKSYR